MPMKHNLSTSYPQIGDLAPDIKLIDTNNNYILMSNIWQAQPTAFIFLRHLGCIFCREQVAWLKAGYSKYKDLGVEIICIAQGDAKVGKAFSILFDLPFPLLLCGNETSIYKQYGLKRGNFSQLFGSASIINGIKALLHGHSQSGITGDGFLLGGTFIVDKDGIILYTHRQMNASDNIKNETLLSEFKKHFIND